MTTEIRDRRETGSAFVETQAPEPTVSDPFQITEVTGILRPEPDQTYFWTQEWQQGEREADDDIAAGRVHRFDDPADALKFLEDL